MGRTVIPVRFEAEAQLAELQRFVRCLRREDREVFQRLYADAKMHLSAVSYANPLNPSTLLQWSAILELERKVEALKREIETLKDKHG